MTQMQTQSAEYWASSNFTLSDSDIEQIYNYLLEVERPQTLASLAKVVINHRIAQEKKELKRRLAGRTVYQPRNTFEVGDELVFPSLQFAQGEVASIRNGTNPKFGGFKVIELELNGKMREFAADLDIDHPLNQGDGLAAVQMEEPNPEEIYVQNQEIIDMVLFDSLKEKEDFIRLADEWFVNGLMVDINVGHLHLSEAILEMSEGGPLPSSEILTHLELGDETPVEVQKFSLNYALLQDDRFDEVAPPGKVAWFLRRMEPTAVRDTPDRLIPNSPNYDTALLGMQLRQLERELDDEWSDLEPLAEPREVTISLTYPHRLAGTLPLSARTSPLFPLGVSTRQLVTLVDAQSGEEMRAWVVAEGRYIFGLSEWYSQHEIPVGGYIHLSPTDEVGRVLIDFERRKKARKEYVRLATVENNRLHFDIEKRAIGSEYDDLLIVGTDYVAAVDALFQSGENRNRSLTAQLVSILPSLAEDSPQKAVHAKTLYSAVNMLRRVTPGAVFAELVKHPAFVAVGDQYWQFNPNKWQGE